MKKVLAATLIIACGIMRATDYYVDYDNGSDGNTGTSTGSAWKHAPDDPDASGNADMTLQPGDKVVFKGGVVYRGRIDIASAGTEAAPIIYDGNFEGSWGTGKAVIDGSEPFTGTWTQCGSADECGGNPDYADVYWTEAPAEHTFFTTLYEDGAFLWFSQYPTPADPFFYDTAEEFKTVPTDDARYGMTRTSCTDPDVFTQTDTAYWDGAYILVYRYGNAVNVARLSSYDPGTHTVSFPDIGVDLNVDDHRYAVINHPALISQPGEYCFDQAAGRLYVWPRDTADLSDGISIAHEELGISVTASHVYVRGFLVRNQFADVDRYNYGCGIRARVTGGSITAIDISGNEVYGIRTQQSTQGGIYLQNVAASRVTGNYVHHNQKSKGIHLSFCNGVVVDSNRVGNNGGTGILFMDTENSVMARNTVYNVLGIHNNALTVYQNSGNILVACNRTYNAPYFSFTMQASSDVTVYGNLFNGGGDNREVADFAGMSGEMRFINNTVVCPGRGNPFESVDWTGDDGGTYTVINNIMHGGGAGDVHTHNLYTALAWYQTSGYGWSLDDGESLHENLNDVFADTASDDFSLAMGSPAIHAGIDPLPYLPVDSFPDFDFTVDISGNMRPVGEWDLGAFEFSAGSIVSRGDVARNSWSGIPNPVTLRELRNSGITGPWQVLDLAGRAVSTAESFTAGVCLFKHRKTGATRSVLIIK